MYGTPLPVLFYDVYSVTFILVHIVVLLFEIFGAFNIEGRGDAWA